MIFVRTHCSLTCWLMPSWMVRKKLWYFKYVLLVEYTHPFLGVCVWGGVCFRQNVQFACLPCIYAFLFMMLALLIFTTHFREMCQTVRVHHVTSNTLTDWTKGGGASSAAESKMFNNLNFLAFLSVYVAGAFFVLFCFVLFFLTHRSRQSLRPKPQLKTRRQNCLGVSRWRQRRRSIIRALVIVNSRFIRLLYVVYISSVSKAYISVCIILYCTQRFWILITPSCNTSKLVSYMSSYAKQTNKQTNKKQMQYQWWF